MSEHHHEHEDKSLKQTLFRFGAGILFLALALYFEKAGFSRFYYILCYVISYLVFGYDVLFEAVKNLFHGVIFDENFLMSIASVGAVLLGDYKEAVAVMMLYMIGESAQDAAVDSSVRNIEKAMNLVSPYANVKVGTSFEKIKPEDVEVGMILRVLPGEKIPVDGKIVYGTCYLDTSALTGESLPVLVKEGSEVLSGSVVTDSPVEMECTSYFKESAVSKILELVEKAKEKKSHVESFITRFAKVYTPSVFGIAVAVAVIPVLVGGDFHEWLYRALEFLVISCPCALVISVPLTFFAGIGCFAKNGILVKGSNHIETLAETQVFAFDKTGTLTEGKFKVTKCSLTETEHLSVLYSLENNSNHPLAKAVCDYCQKQGASLLFVSELKEVPGKGIEGRVEVAGKKVSAKCGRFGETDEKTGKDSVVSLYINESNVGSVLLKDSLKDGVASAVKKLKQMEIKKTVILSGDTEESVKSVSEEAGTDCFYAELLPLEKVKVVNELSCENRTAFVGDGINDAPVLISAHTGLSMGKGGSDSAISASGIVIMKDEISKIPFAFGAAKKTVAIAKQNIGIALTFKILCMVLAGFGFATMSLAVFADVGVCLICIVNSLRALRF